MAVTNLTSRYGSIHNENQRTTYILFLTFVNHVLWVTFQFSQKADKFQYFEYIIVNFELTEVN